MTTFPCETSLRLGSVPEKESSSLFNDLDFNNNELLLISDGSMLGCYKKNVYGSYSMIGNGSVEGFSSFRLFIGVTAGNVNQDEENNGRMTLYVDKVYIKEENLKLNVKDSTQSIIAQRGYSLDNYFRWNYLTFTPGSSGTYTLNAYCNASVNLIGDKVMICDMSEVKQNLFNVDDTQESVVEIGPNDYDYNDGFYEYTLYTDDLPGTSFVTSGKFRVKTDLDDITQTNVNSFAANCDKPSIFENYIVWTQMHSGFYKIYIKDVQGTTYGPYGIANKDLRNATIYGNHVVVECHTSSSTAVDLKILEINRTIDSGSGFFRSLGLDLFIQRNPHINGDRIVFEGNESGGDFDIYVYDLDVDDDSIIDFYESDYGDDTDDDGSNDEDPIDFLDNDGDNETDEDRNYFGLYLLDLKDEYFEDEDWDQVLPRIYGDKIVFKDTKNNQESVWLANIVVVEPYKGQLTEACLDSDSDTLIAENANGFSYNNIRISKDIVLYTTMVGYKKNIYQTDYRNSIEIFDISHQKKIVLPINASSFDVYNENLIYTTMEDELGCYDLNEEMNFMLLPESKGNYLSPSIYGNTFTWLNKSSTNYRVECYSQYFTVSSTEFETNYLETSKVIPVDKFTNDFGPDVLEYLYGLSSPEKYSFTVKARNPIDITFDHLGLNLEFIMDPMDPDTDYDNINDGEEIVTFGGIAILECEDAQVFKPWTPIDGSREFLSVNNEETKIMSGYGFFQPRSVSLISSHNESVISDSWITMDYVAPKTGTYRFSLNYPAESRKEKLVGTMIPGNLPKTELLPNGSATVEDVVLDYGRASYLEDIIAESFSMEVKYSYSEISPISYSGESTFDTSINIMKVVNLSSSPDSPSQTLAIGEINAEGQYNL